MLIYATIWLFILAAGTTTVLAFAWWIDEGGMQEFDAQANAIFALDDDTSTRERTLPTFSTRGN